MSAVVTPCPGKAVREDTAFEVFAKGLADLGAWYVMVTQSVELARTCTGIILDDSGAPDESFDEIWHLMKSRQDGSGWVLAGIQQTQ